MSRTELVVNAVILAAVSAPCGLVAGFVDAIAIPGARAQGVVRRNLVVGVLVAFLSVAMFEFRLSAASAAVTVGCVAIALVFVVTGRRLARTDVGARIAQRLDVDGFVSTIRRLRD